MDKKKVELLSPAGNWEGFAGAIEAGADAVYLGGKKYGARAYADNFSEEEVCSALRYAHLFGRKVYLTVNTLVKERELEELPEYLMPFYEAGLDGIIVQDFGVFSLVRERFPDLPVHVSTQMTVTGSRGARLLHELGASRIIPARELTLGEIRTIKREVPVEIETFVHGAMCYSYSGQCLFSSMLGGRSGNRGRCAQPCRLPYEVKGEKQYPLSLKDMCTLKLLPQLIGAGIDSFKIEGRMKKPEYTAGVTAIYRKYIDRYEERPEGPFRVEEEDEELLRSLYIRSGTGTGYYERERGREMVTISSPAYRQNDDRLLERIRERYLGREKKLPVKGRAVLREGEELRYTLTAEGREGKEISFTAQGQAPARAQSQPLTEEGIRRQLGKMGNTSFELRKLAVETDGRCFVPVKALNELRRRAAAGLAEAVACAEGYARREKIEGRYPVSSDEPGTIPGQAEGDGEGGFSPPCADSGRKALPAPGRAEIHALVCTLPQLKAAVTSGVERIYVEGALCLNEETRRWLSDKDRKGVSEFYLALPHILRSGDDAYLQGMRTLLASDVFAGVLVRNLEGLAWCLESKERLPLTADTGLYVFNTRSWKFLTDWVSEISLPYELNEREISELRENRRRQGEEAAAVRAAYGRIPLMITANCLRKTTGDCRGGGNLSEPSWEKLTDRYRKDFPVRMYCGHCYNILYNSVPLSLHRWMGEVLKDGAGALRLDFTTEDGDQTSRTVEYFKRAAEKGESAGEPPFAEYTGGHAHRGVE